MSPNISAIPDTEQAATPINKDSIKKTLVLQEPDEHLGI